MIKVKQLISLLMFAVLLFSYQSIYSQTTTSAVNGTVVDQNGNPLPGANVIAVHQPSGTQFGTTSRNDGKYNLVNLRTGGPYKVTVSFVGYTTQVEEGFNLELGQNLKINFKLPNQVIRRVPAFLLFPLYSVFRLLPSAPVVPAGWWPGRVRR